MASEPSYPGAPGPQGFIPIIYNSPRTHVGGRLHPQSQTAQVEGQPDLHGAPIEPARRLKIVLHRKLPKDPIVIDSDSDTDPDAEGILVSAGKEQVDRRKGLVVLKLGNRLKDNNKMPFEGVDLTADAAPIPYSWRDPHPLFVIILVGPDENPFGIQKDLLCAHSSYFRQQFDQAPAHIEQVFKLADTDHIIFGCFQNFIFTGKVYDKSAGHEIPSYPVLYGLWRLATKLAMAPLRIAVLETMTDRRDLTGHIPDAPLLEQAWKETEEGSGLRKMLINWAAEHMRSGPASRNEFVHGLPKHILTELVLTMGDMASNGPVSPLKHKASFNNPVDIEFEQSKPSVKRRKSEAVIRSNPQDEAYEIKPVAKKARKSEPVRRPAAQRRSTATPSDFPITPEQDIEDCRLLINRMLTAPSYWTRYIKYFRDPVDPVRDNLENYTTVVKHPMDLKTIQTKMNNNEYQSSAQFEADIRQIFQNAYEFWQKEDIVFKECELFESFFNKQWANRHSKAGGSKVKAELLED